MDRDPLSEGCRGRGVLRAVGRNYEVGQNGCELLQGECLWEHWGTYGYYLASGPTLGALQLVSDSATNLSPQLNPSQAGFLGDYSSIAASTAAGSSVVYPNWSDTRNLSASGQPDEDVFIAKVTLP